MKSDCNNKVLINWSGYQPLQLHHSSDTHLEEVTSGEKQKQPGDRGREIGHTIHFHLGMVGAFLAGNSQARVMWMMMSKKSLQFSAINSDFLA